MGRYNEFVCRVPCPGCGVTSEIMFQTDLGRLEYHVIRMGDPVFNRPILMSKSPVGPIPQPIRDSFWAFGQGSCPLCRRGLWARIEVRSDRFDAFALVPSPQDPSTWGYLP